VGLVVSRSVVMVRSMGAAGTGLIARAVLYCDQVATVHFLLLSCCC
jgi:pyridoxal biosynthesis lyase PdxS